jgi:hypothetical protein
MMLSAATVRRPAVVLGAILSALTVTGPAWGQALGGVGSAVSATTEAVTGATSKAAEPVTRTVAKATQPVASTVSAATRAAEPVRSAGSSPVGKPTKGTARPAASVDTAASQARRPVKRLAATPTDTVSQTLEVATAAVLSEAQALLGSLVETVGGRAEELTGSLLGSRSSPLDGAVNAVTSLLAPAEVLEQGSWGISGGGFVEGVSPPVAPRASARGPGTPSGRTGPAPVVGDRSPIAPPIQLVTMTPEPAAARRGGESSSPVAPPATPERSTPAAPASAFGSSTGLSAAFAVLAGLFALALSGFLGRLLPWSDTIRPLAFVLPPERPG